MVSVRTNSIPRDAAVSPVPNTATNHMWPGIAINIASATTRRLALVSSRRPGSAENTASSHCGANNATTINGAVAMIAPPMALRSTPPIQCSLFLPTKRLTMEQVVSEKPIIGTQNTM